VQAALAMRGLSGALYGVAPTDGATFVGAGLLVLLAASVAALLPARRAGKVNPVNLLRSE
jgi:ABC-type antimicrobial peptide transport system permease subunit